MVIGTESRIMNKLVLLSKTYQNLNETELQEALNYLAQKLTKAKKDLTNWDKNPSDTAVIWALPSVDKKHLQELINLLTALLVKVNKRLEELQNKKAA